MESILKQRLFFGGIIASIHFLISMVLLLCVMAAAGKPIGDSFDIVYVILLEIFMFPLGLLQLFISVIGQGSFGIPGIILIPMNSMLWGWIAARLIVRNKKRSSVKNAEIKVNQRIECTVESDSSALITREDENKRGGIDPAELIRKLEGK